MKIKHWLILFIFLSTAPSAKSQVITSFTPDSLLFIGEISSYFERIPDNAKNEQALLSLESFNQLWIAETFSPLEKQSIYRLSNLMLSKKVNPYPNFQAFVEILTQLKNQNYPSSQIMIWMDGIEKSLDNIRSLKNFKTLMEFSDGLIQRNEINSTRIFSWLANTNEFSFSSDSVFHIEFDDINLKCRTKQDSSIIYNTSGKYYPLDKLWQGSSGKITWERAGIRSDEVYALFGNYTIPLKSSSFTIESVNFYALNHFPEPLTGSLTEKLSSGLVSPESAIYPYFKSDNNKHYIPDIFKDVDYEGGFAMKGAAIIGESDEFTVCKLTFKRAYRDKNGNYDLLIARSKSFIIKPDKISASRAMVSIHHQEDSIFHSEIQFKYTNNNREVALLREKKGLQASLYIDSFHNVDIDCEAVYWKMDQAEIRFSSIMGIQPLSEALFISDKYFIETNYDKLQGLDRVHPLIVIYDYARKYNTDRFYVYELARYLKMSENTMERQMIRLAKYGFVFFNPDTKQVVVNEKLYHYIASKNGRTDYDVISFYSKVENKDNATLHLDNFDMKISGVPGIFISDSQQVFIYPTKEEVILRKNMDFLFSGKIKVGLFEFQATDCTFEYDTFKLNLPTIDEMKFKVRAFDDEDGETNFVDVKTVISNISGELLIDHPSNKNSLRDYPEYPIFTSNKESFVYYNQDSVHNNAYTPETFNYHLQPFTINKLADFSNNNLQFGGNLNSAGIFPAEVNSPLRVMPDYSLGFQVVSPPEGYPIYGNKGTFYDTVTLSNSGLKASGTIEYLNTVAKGTDLLLYPDSAIGLFDEFSIQKQQTAQTEFPSVYGQNLTQLWLPYQDSLMLATTDSTVQIFDDLVHLDGTLTYTPQNLSGSGNIDFFTARAKSSNYNFGTDFFSSDSLNLTIKDLNEESVAFSSDQFSAYVDLAQNTGKFKAVSNDSKVEFPLTRFSAGIDEFDWYIHRNEIALRSDAVNSNVDISALSLREMMDVTPNGTRFTSLHPLQDSLWFYAQEASFNIADTTLIATDVKMIKVADAAIFPGDGVLEIKNNASITPLRDAMIIADTINKIHLITSALVNIESRYSYKASGTYSYVNLVEDTQIIDFDRITVDTTYHTIAEGKITPEQSFMFSPRFTYQGEVSLNAVEPELYFDGAYKIVQDCNPTLSRWVSFESRITPDSLAFPVAPRPEEFGKKKLYAGFFHSNENNRVYSAFLSNRSYFSDTLMMSIDGVITERKKGTEFLISAPQDVGIPEDEYPSWPYIALNTDDCKIKASGEVNFGTDFGKVQMKAFGQTEHFIIPDSTLFNVFITLDFFFNEEALTYLASSLNASNAQGVEPSNAVSDIAYNLLLGEEEATSFVFDLNSFGTPKNIPEALNTSLVISDVSLTYHPDSRSFISEGPIGIGMIGGQGVNKYFDGHLEIVRKRSGDIIQLYVEIDRRHWYFFNYSGNLMQTVSSKNEYNRLISSEDAKKRMDDAEKGEAAYRYIISTSQKKNRFLRAVRAANINEEEE